MYKKILLIAFTCVGFTAIIAQTLFIREIQQIFYGNELCLGVLFAGWLFFAGLGSILGRRIRKNIFIELQILLSLLLLTEFWLIHSIRKILNVGIGELISPIPMISISFTIFAPLSMTIGLLFVQGCEWWTQESKDKIGGVSEVYILDAIGDMIGGFIFAYLCIKLFSVTTLFIVGILNLCIAFILSKKRKIKWIILVLEGIWILGVCMSQKIEYYSAVHNYPGYKIVNQKSSIYGKLVLVKKESLYSLYESGLLSFTYPVPIEAEEKAHFPMFQVKEPSNVLLLGGNIETVKELLKHPIQKLQWIKLDPKIMEVCKPWIDLSPIEDTRVNIKWEDGRRFVKKYKGEKFDVVIVDVGEPYTALVNRFYTLEFFKEVSKILSPNGVVAIEVTSNPNYLSPELREYNGIIYKTFKKVFPKVVLIPGEILKLFGSKESEWLSQSADTISLRINIPTKYVTKHYIPHRLYKDRINYVQQILDNFTPKILNTDFHPISYYYDIVLKGAYFSRWFSQTFIFFSKIPWWLTLGAVVLVFIFISLFTRASVFGIGILGATGIGSQLLLILSFEIIYGYMYHKLGIIVGGFMLGLSIGAYWAKKWNNNLLYVIGLTLLYLGVAFFVIKWLSFHTIKEGEIFFYILPICGGTLIGSAWALANRELISQGERVEKSVGLLNGVDLFGSCVGSFFISVFFIPVYGVNFSFLLLGVLNLIAFCSSCKTKFIR